MAGRAVVDSRWWYWVAALPVIAAFWLVTALWLWIATSAEFGAGPSGDPGSFAFSVTTLFAGVPFLVSLAVFPAAVYFDARALAAAGASWQPDPRRYGALAVATLPTGPAGSVPLACYYCYRRYRAVAFG